MTGTSSRVHLPVFTGINNLPNDIDYTNNFFNLAMLNRQIRDKIR